MIGIRAGVYMSKAILALLCLGLSLNFLKPKSHSSMIWFLLKTCAGGVLFAGQFNTLYVAMIGNDEHLLPVYMAYVYSVLFYFCLIFALWFFSITYRESLAELQPEKRNTILSIVVSIVILAVLFYFKDILRQRDLSPITLAFTACMAFFEEALYRYLLPIGLYQLYQHNQLRSRIAAPGNGALLFVVIIVGNLCFAMAHGSISLFLNHFIWGMCASVVLFSTKNLFVAGFFHFAYNLLAR